MGRATSLATLALLFAVEVSMAQSCAMSPVSFNELWLSGASWHGAETSLHDFGFELSVQGRIAVSGHSGAGGFDVSGHPTSSMIRLGALASLGKVKGCVFVGTESMRYTFRERHEVDRGTVDDELRNVGLRIEAPSVEIGDVRMVLWASPNVSRRVWEMQGRRLMVRDSLWVEEVTWIDVSWHVAGQSGLSLRWRRLGVTAGVARRPSFGSEVLAFLRVGVAAIVLP